MKRALIAPVLLGALLAGGATRIVQDQCGPFTDVTPAFCPYVLELYYLGITAGTSATTFSPDDPLTRGQGAVFIAKGLNQSLARSSPRAALGQWWTTTPHWDLGLGVTTVDPVPLQPACDGADVWTPNIGGSSVSRVRASDGKLLGTWTGAQGATFAFSAMGRIFVTARSGDSTGFGGTVYAIDPTQSPGPVTLVANTLWNDPEGIAFDGTNLWVVSAGDVIYTKGGALSIVHPGSSYPWTFTTIKPGVELPTGGVIYDGHNIWFSNGVDLRKVDADGNILQIVPLQHPAQFLTFDGQNIWAPSQDGNVSVVSAATGALLATLTDASLDDPISAAFDGERVLVTSTGFYRQTPGVSLWRAADFTFLGTFPVAGQGNMPYGVCSDGTNFWVTLENSPGQLGRF